MPIPDTAKEIIEAMPRAFQPEKAQGLRATYQLELSGEGGGTWVMEIADGRCQVREGRADAPDGTLTMAANDYVALAKGELDVMGAFMSGRIQFQGDLGLAAKLPSLFKR